MNQRAKIGLVAMVGLAALIAAMMLSSPTRPVDDPEGATSGGASSSTPTSGGADSGAEEQAPSAPGSDDAGAKAALGEGGATTATTASGDDAGAEADATIAAAALDDVGHGARSPEEPADGEPADGGGDKPTGRISKETIREGIKGMTPAVKKCYEELLKEFPDAEGQIKLQFSIVADDEGVGRVDLEKVLDTSTLHEQDLHDCLIQETRNIEFPAPEGGGEVKVTYPFNFATTPDQPDAG